MRKIIFNLRRVFNQMTEIYEQYLSRIVFMALLLFVFIFLRQLPYINIIAGYNYYVVAIYLFLIIGFFRKKLPNKKLYLIVELIIIVMLLGELFSLRAVTDFLGFIVFTLLVVVGLVDFIAQRRKLKEY